MKVPFFSAGDGSCAIVPNELQTEVIVSVGTSERTVSYKDALKAIKGLPRVGDGGNRVEAGRTLAKAIFNL